MLCLKWRIQHSQLVGFIILLNGYLKLYNFFILLHFLSNQTILIWNFVIRVRDPFFNFSYWKLICTCSLFDQVLGHGAVNSSQYPLVVSTWPFLDAVRAGWRAVDSGLSAVDAVVEGCSACEELRCDGTGWILNMIMLN